MLSLPQQPGWSPRVQTGMQGRQRCQGQPRCPSVGVERVEGRRWVPPGPLEADCGSAWQGMRNLPK